MNASRLAKLASLTRGAAVVGIGVASAAGTAACTKGGEQPQPPVINAPVMLNPTSSASAPSASPDDSAVPVRRIPIPNAMPPRLLRTDGGADGG